MLGVVVWDPRSHALLEPGSSPHNVGLGRAQPGNVRTDPALAATFAWFQLHKADDTILIGSLCVIHTAAEGFYGFFFFFWNLRYPTLSAPGDYYCYRKKISVILTSDLSAPKESVYIRGGLQQSACPVHHRLAACWEMRFATSRQLAEVRFLEELRISFPHLPRYKPRGLGNVGHLKQSIKVADPFITRRTDFIHIKPTAAWTRFWRGCSERHLEASVICEILHIFTISAIFV